MHFVKILENKPAQIPLFTEQLCCNCLRSLDSYAIFQTVSQASVGLPAAD